jgi:hypothetical protein
MYFNAASGMERRERSCLTDGGGPQAGLDGAGGAGHIRRHDGDLHHLRDHYQLAIIACAAVLV